MFSSTHLRLESLESRETPSGTLPNFTLTGPRGGILVVATTVEGTTLDQSVTITGPQGRSVSENSSFTYSPRSETINGTFTVTGPNQTLITGTVAIDVNAAQPTGTITIVGVHGREFIIPIG